MQIVESFFTALTALKSNKTRSFLTMLGVIIGVFAVITLVALVKGVENYVTDQFNALGSNLIIVAPGRVSGFSDPSAAFTNPKLELQDIDNIRRYGSGHLVGVVPNIRLSKVLKYKTKTYLGTLVGTDVNFSSVADFKVAKGRMFTKDEESAKARVVVLGYGANKELFGNTDSLEKLIKINNISYRVVGVFESKGPNADDRVVLPYTTMQNVFNIKKLSGITAKATGKDNIDIAMVDIQLALLKRLKKDDFTVISQKDILNSVGKILDVLAIGVSTIAAISLLVGGIGIMNIMLVSVNERIKEIGLRKALGATSFQIGFQFMLESVIISIFGGLLGIVCGYAVTKGVSSLIRAEIPLWALLTAFSFSLIVGLVFGTYPAYKASKKEPIEALRYE